MTIFACRSNGPNNIILLYRTYVSVYISFTPLLVFVSFFFIIIKLSLNWRKQKFGRNILRGFFSFYPLSNAHEGVLKVDVNNLFVTTHDYIADQHDCIIFGLCPLVFFSFISLEVCFYFCIAFFACLFLIVSKKNVFLASQCLNVFLFERFFFQCLNVILNEFKFCANLLAKCQRPFFSSKRWKCVSFVV